MPTRLDAFRSAFAAATGLPVPSDAFAFGDTPELADELLALVLDGRKRATAALYADLDHRHEPPPARGDLAVVLDGRGQPAAVIRTTDVRIGPFHRVDAAFAWDEGEGDRTLASWVDAHERFFRRRCAELGIAFSDDLPVVFERFELVWPD